MRRTYWPELDGLRALAVTAVVLFHSDPDGPIRGGFVGVDLFFVLSAFLITSILADERNLDGRINLARFYWRRLLRLMPPLLLFLAGYLAFAPLIWPGHNHVRDSLLTALYVSDYSYALWRLPLYLQHTWSLSVEEQFYLVWPLILLPLLRSRRPLAWLGCAYLAITLWRLSFHGDWQEYYYRFDTRASGLVMGAMLFFILPRIRISSSIALGAFCLFAIVLVTGNIALANNSIPFAEVGAAVLIASALGGNLPVLAHPALVGVGKLSYAIYLWHYPIAYAMRDQFGFAATAALTFALSLAAAAASYFTVEAWARSIRRRRPRSGSDGGGLLTDIVQLAPPSLAAHGKLDTQK